jgi:uncharacterized protein YjbI with pentapeptide repeats
MPLTRDEILTQYTAGKRDFARAYLVGVNLADANLAGVNFTDANLADADLAGSNLAHANLAHANLVGSNLAHANLAHANLAHAILGDQWIIQGAIRSDGYHFMFQKMTADTEPMVRAGCRHFTLAQAREHWIATRLGTPLGDETFAILGNLETLARIRGHIS